MKLLNSLLALGLILSSIPSLADVPNCLTDRGVDANRNRLIDGEYNLLVDTTDYSKEKLLELVDSLLHYPNVYASGFPQVFGGKKLSIVLRPLGISAAESFGQIKARVEGDIRKIQELMGATVRCNFHAIPHPSASGGT